MKKDELVTTGWAHGTFDAYLAMSMLMSAGIPVHAQPLHTQNANWTLSQALMPALFGIGLVLAFIALRSGSLWPAVVVHGSFNSLMTISVYIALATGAGL